MAWVKRVMAGLWASVGLVLLSSCTTMSKDECLMGDWGQKGYQDGLSGYDATRLDDHALACSKHGVNPNPAAYMSAREDGLRFYCRWENGFAQGRRGNSYRGVCLANEELEFLPAYQDGRDIYAAEQALSSAQKDLRSAQNLIRDRDQKLSAKQRELRQSGLSDEDRHKIRERIQEVRGELQQARRLVRLAEDDLVVAQVELRTVMRIIGSRYGLK